MDLSGSRKKRDRQTYKHGRYFLMLERKYPIICTVDMSTLNFLRINQQRRSVYFHTIQKSFTVTDFNIS